MAGAVIFAALQPYHIGIETYLLGGDFPDYRAFNRTILELKLEVLNQDVDELPPSTVPYWN